MSILTVAKGFVDCIIVNIQGSNSTQVFLSEFLSQISLKVLGYNKIGIQLSWVHQTNLMPKNHRFIKDSVTWIGFDQCKRQ